MSIHSFCTYCYSEARGESTDDLDSRTNGADYFGANLYFYIAMRAEDVSDGVAL